MPPFQVGNSTQIADKAYEVLKNATSCLTRCECKIFSASDNKSIEVKPMYIEQMTIMQNFETDYSDVITLNVSVTTSEAILLLTNYKNLKCTLTFNRVDNQQNLLDDVLPEIFNYVVVISNATDKLKNVTKAEVTQTDVPGESSGSGSLPSESVQSKREILELQLIDEDVYIKRDRPFHFILQNTTMLEAIHYFANLLDIKNIHYRSVDNERDYENFVIPPMQTLASIFDYLQEHFGVYAKGLTGYYTRQNLYIYPTFDVNTDVEDTVHLFKTQKGYYQACPSYHLQEGKTTTIILTGKTVLENLTEKMSENVGNYQVSLRAEAVHDVGKEFNGRECKIRNNNLLSIATQDQHQVQDGKVSARYMQATNNAYSMSAVMAQSMCKFLGAEWFYAWPYTLKPGSKVVYHYEDVDAVKTCDGILSSVVYNLQKATTRDLEDGGKGNIYAWCASIYARLTSDTNESDALDVKQLPFLNENKDQPDTVNI